MCDEVKKRENEVEEPFNDSWTQSSDISGPLICTHEHSVTHMLENQSKEWSFGLFVIKPRLTIQNAFKFSSLEEVKPAALNVSESVCVSVRDESNGFIAVVFLPVCSLNMCPGTEFSSTNICFLLFFPLQKPNSK